MRFATLSHLMNEKNLEQIPKAWIKNQLIISPPLNINGTKGYVIALKLTAQQIMNLPSEDIRQRIFEGALYAQNELDIDIIQLGALTTSVTSGGIWLSEQEDYTGFLTHGDSYTAAVTSQAVIKATEIFEKQALKLNLAIVGAYGIIGEAVSKILTPKFNHTKLIGRREEKLIELETKIKGNYTTTTDLETKKADVIITATSHPKALLQSKHLKKDAIIIDVSQPPNASYELCKKRPDIIRIDGGFVDFPSEYPMPIPGVPPGKNYACIAEVIMQAMENENKNHLGSIDINYLQKTEQLGEKYGFKLNELTNFGNPLNK